MFVPNHKAFALFFEIRGRARKLGLAGKELAKFLAAAEAGKLVVVRSGKVVSP